MVVQVRVRHPNAANQTLNHIVGSQKPYQAVILTPRLGGVCVTTIQSVCVLCLNVLGRLVRQEKNQDEDGGKQNDGETWHIQSSIAMATSHSEDTSEAVK